MIAETFPELGMPTPREKLILAGEPVGEYDATPQDTPPDAAMGRVLDARMEEYRRNPDSALSWEDFRKKWGMPLDE
jgi:hypothetical protein